MLHLSSRFKTLFKPHEVKGAGVHFLVGPDYTLQGFQQRAIYRNDKGKNPRPPLGVIGQEWINRGQLLTTQGAPLFASKAAIQSGFSDGLVLGTQFAQPATGYAGRPLQYSDTDIASEYSAINA